jgi:hypothetical protein
MAQTKKKFARLVLLGISILGVLFGLFCFFFAIDFIFTFERENISYLFFSLIIGWMLILGAFLLYPSYKMLRGRSFDVLKSIAALLALSAFSLIEPLIEFINTLINREMSIGEQTIVDCGSFLLVLLIVVLVYKISIKLLERLQKAAYGPNQISETKHSTDKQ